MLPETKTSNLSNKRDTPRVIRKSEEFSRLVTKNDQSSLITGTSPANAVSYNSLDEGRADGFNVDIENNADFGVACNTENSPQGYQQYIDSLSSVQIWLIVAVLLILVVVTVVLYFTGNSAQIVIIWGRIFCWIGLTKCSDTASTIDLKGGYINK